MSLGFGDSCSGPEKTFTGISAQQYIKSAATKGIKVALNLQTKDDAELSAVIQLILLNYRIIKGDMVLINLISKIFLIS